MSELSQTSAVSLVEKVKSSLIRNANEDGGALTEAMLCKRLKVSRSAIRDALAQLESQKIIERRKKKGTSLRRPTLKEIVDLWDSRSALEGVAARLASQKITKSELNKLAHLIEQRDQAYSRNDAQKVDQYDIAFHQLIIDIADNTCVIDIVRNIHLFDRIFRYPHAPYSSFDEHQDYGHAAIVQALRSGDPDKSENLMKRHIQEAKKRRVEALIGKINLFE